MDKLNYSDEIKKRLSEMSPIEKEGHIDMIEELTDYGQGYLISVEDRELYKALIEERANKNQVQKPSLADKIQSAEARKSNQNITQDVNSHEQGR